MDTAQWPQEIVVKPIEEIVTSCPKQQQQQGGNLDQRKVVRPQKEQALNCPRCNSTNTKFCYYNNYSLTQPRYFCKTCRRYWTEGGSLRNIPVGGGSRKNKRSSSSTSSNPSKKLPDLVTPPTPTITTNQNPKIHEPQDLNLAFPAPQDFRTNISSSSALELLTGITNSNRGFTSFMPLQDPNTVYTSGFSLQEFKPASLNFSLDGLGTNYGETTSTSGGGGRLLFPFEDLKQPSNVNDHQNRDQQGDHISTGYWTGMLGGGSW